MQTAKLEVGGDLVVRPLERDTAEKLRAIPLKLVGTCDGGRVAFVLHHPGAPKPFDITHCLRATLSDEAIALILSDGASGPGDAAQDKSDDEAVSPPGAEAIIGFLRTGLNENAAASMFGVAALLSQSEHFRESYDLAEYLIKVGISFARVHILAGFCAHRLGKETLARKHLAKAAFIARRTDDAIAELRLSQQLLLNQQFGN